MFSSMQCLIDEPDRQLWVITPDDLPGAICSRAQMRAYSFQFVLGKALVTNGFSPDAVRHCRLLKREGMPAIFSSLAGTEKNLSAFLKSTQWSVSYQDGKCAMYMEVMRR